MNNAWLRYVKVQSSQEIYSHGEIKLTRESCFIQWDVGFSVHWMLNDILYTYIYAYVLYIYKYVFTDLFVYLSVYTFAVYIYIYLFIYIKGSCEKLFFSCWNLDSAMTRRGSYGVRVGHLRSHQTW
jgi:hypothetical protein